MSWTYSKCIVEFLCIECIIFLQYLHITLPRKEGPGSVVSILCQQQFCCSVRLSVWPCPERPEGNLIEGNMLPLNAQPKMWIFSMSISLYLLSQSISLLGLYFSFELGYESTWVPQAGKSSFSSLGITIC